MKKLMMLALGLGLALGSVSFAQDATPAPKTEKTKKAKTKKAKKTKTSKTDTTAPKM